MSYDFPSSPAPKRRGGGGMFFLIVLAIGGFLIFSRMGDGPAAPQGGGPGDILESPQNTSGRSAPIDDGYAAERERVFGSEDSKSTARKKMPTTGSSGAASDWNMSDAGVSKNGTGVATQPKNGKTQNGDWAMEDGPTKKNDDNQFKLSNPPNQKPAKNNDWSIDNVDPKKPAKKTEKGDWAIEDGGAQKK